MPGTTGPDLNGNHEAVELQRLLLPRAFSNRQLELEYLARLEPMQRRMVALAFGLALLGNLAAISVYGQVEIYAKGNSTDEAPRVQQAHEIISAIVVMSIIVALFISIVNIGPLLCKRAPNISYLGREKLVLGGLLYVFCTIPVTNTWRLTKLLNLNAEPEVELDDYYVIRDVRTSNEDRVAHQLILACICAMHLGSWGRVRLCIFVDVVGVATSLVTVAIHNGTPVNLLTTLTTMGCITATLIYGHTSQDRSMRLNFLFERELVATQVALEAANKELEAARGGDRELMMAMTFHEVRNPLNGTAGYLRLAKHLLSELLSSGLLPAPAAGRGDGAECGGEGLRGKLGSLMEELDCSLASTELAVQYLQTLATLHGALTGNRKLVLGPTELPKLVHDAATVVRPQLQPGVELRVETDDGLMLTQVLINLMQNAARFTAHGFICVRCSIVPAADGAAGFTASFAVLDTGSGMSQQTRETLFDLYKSVGGIGLGMFLCGKHLQRGQSAVFGSAELATPASALGYLWLWAALRPLEEPLSYSACPQRLRCRRQAVPKSRILLRLAIRLLSLLGTTLRVASPWQPPPPAADGGAAGEAPSGTGFYFDIDVAPAPELPPAPAPAPRPAAPALGGAGGGAGGGAAGEGRACVEEVRIEVGDGLGRSGATGGVELHTVAASLVPDGAGAAEGAEAAEAAEAAGGAEAQPALAAPPAFEPGLCVLVADDGVVNRRLLRRAFTGYFGDGWLVSEAATAEEALERALATDFALIVMDEIFSQEPTAMRGSAAIQQLRASESLKGKGEGGRACRAIIVSCTGNALHVAHGDDLISMGADLVWGKPMPSFTNGDMQRQLSAHLAMRKGVKAGAEP